MTSPLYRPLLLAALLAPIFVGCRATPADGSGAWHEDPATAAAANAAPSAPRRATAPAPSAPQDDDVPFDRMHPRAMIALSGLVGEIDVEENDGVSVASLSADSLGGRFSGEYFLANQFGFQLTYMATQSEDIPINGIPTIPDVSFETENLFVGLGYRAFGMNDGFRMPVRIGFFSNTGTAVANFPEGDFSYGLTGVRLSAEPEFVLMQSVHDKRVAELSVFTEIACGNGVFDAENDVESESGYAFQFSAEAGARYRFRNGVLAGLSYIVQKTNYGATDSYNNTGFAGIEYDITGVMFTLGARF